MVWPKDVKRLVQKVSFLNGLSVCHLIVSLKKPNCINFKSSHFPHLCLFFFKFTNILNLITNNTDTILIKTNLLFLFKKYELNHVFSAHKKRVFEVRTKNSCVRFVPKIRV